MLGPFCLYNKAIKKVNLYCGPQFTETPPSGTHQEILLRWPNLKHDHDPPGFDEATLSALSHRRRSLGLTEMEFSLETPKEKS